MNIHISVNYLKSNNILTPNIKKITDMYNAGYMEHNRKLYRVI